MEENIVTWNMTNWITIVFMGIVFYGLWGLGSSIVRKRFGA
jgi:hypothetical protein